MGVPVPCNLQQSHSNLQFCSCKAQVAGCYQGIILPNSNLRSPSNAVTCTWPPTHTRTPYDITQDAAIFGKGPTYLHTVPHFHFFSRLFRLVTLSFLCSKLCLILHVPTLWRRLPTTTVDLERPCCENGFSPF